MWYKVTTRHTDLRVRADHHTDSRIIGGLPLGYVAEVAEVFDARPVGQWMKLAASEKLAGGWAYAGDQGQFLKSVDGRDAPVAATASPSSLPPSTAALRARDLILSHMRWRHRPPQSSTIRYTNWLIGYRLAITRYLLWDGTDLQAEEEWRQYAASTTTIDPVDPHSGGPDGVRQARFVWRHLISEEARRAIVSDDATAREINERLLEFVAQEEFRLGTRIRTPYY